MKIAQVRLSYCMSWYDLNVDDPPVPILVWSNHHRILQSGIGEINPGEAHLILQNLIEDDGDKGRWGCELKLFFVDHEIRIRTSLHNSFSCQSRDITFPFANIGSFFWGSSERPEGKWSMLEDGWRIDHTSGFGLSVCANLSDLLIANTAYPAIVKLSQNDLNGELSWPSGLNNAGYHTNNSIIPYFSSSSLRMAESEQSFIHCSDGLDISEVSNFEGEFILCLSNLLSV
jgi:hypothetical protein